MMLNNAETSVESVDNSDIYDLTLTAFIYSHFCSLFIAEVNVYIYIYIYASCFRPTMIYPFKIDILLNIKLLIAR